MPMLQKYALWFVTLILIACENGNHHETSADEKNSTTSTTSTNSSIHTLHFFLENSGSMFGYFEPSSIEGPEAFQDLGNVLNRLQYQVDSVKTYLISEKVHPIGMTADGFSEYFRPEKMKIKNEGLTSDITKMFSECIQQTSGKDISILVSDGIYSISKEDIVDELKRSSQKTKHELIRQLNSRDFAIAVVKFSGVFNGKYYYPKQGEKKINQIRPYYVWFFGNLEQIREAIEISGIEKEKGYENTAFFFKNDQIQCASTLLDSGPSKIGSYKSTNENAIHIIQNAEKSDRPATENEFQFGLAVDFGDLPLSEEYFENIANYSIEPSYYEVVKVIPASDFDRTTVNTIDLTVKGWTPTHILEIKNKSVLLGPFDLTLDQNLPEWISLSSSDGEGDIVGNTSETFGFNYLMVNGIFEAFDEKNNHMPYSTIQFKVQP
jgi:hypothetical protein